MHGYNNGNISDVHSQPLAGAVAPEGDHQSPVTIIKSGMNADDERLHGIDGTVRYICYEEATQR